MKETIKVNLGNRLFDLDSDAYDRLKTYLNTLKRKFNASPKEADEILEDIEARIAELFSIKIDAKKQVISLEDVEELISQLGTAEEFDDSETSEEEYEEKTVGNTATKKRFFRDRGDSVFGGVSSGLSAYFNIDPIWIRLIFVALFFFNLAGLLIYIILWIVIPPARSTAQRLQMRGKDVTINNIEYSVKGEFENVKSNFKKIPKSQTYIDAQSRISEFMQIIGNIIIVFLKLIGVIIGVSLLFVLIVSVIAILIGGAVIMPGGWIGDWNVPDFVSIPHYTLAGLCLFLVIAIPIIAIIVKISKWLLNIQSRNHIAAGLAATIWVVALISFIVIVVVDIDKKTLRKSAHTEYNTVLKGDKQLYIELNNSSNLPIDLEYFQFLNFELIKDDWNDDYLGTPELEILQTNQKQVKVEVYKSYLNFYIGNHPNDNGRFIEYDVKLTNSTIYLPKYYRVDEDDVWRMPKLKIVISIPEDTELMCNEDASEIFQINCAEIDSPKTNKKERILQKEEELDEEIEESMDDKKKILEELEADLN